MTTNNTEQVETKALWSEFTEIITDVHAQLTDYTKILNIYIDTVSNNTTSSPGQLNSFLKAVLNVSKDIATVRSRVKDVSSRNNREEKKGEVLEEDIGEFYIAYEDIVTLVNDINNTINASMKTIHDNFKQLTEENK